MNNKKLIDMHIHSTYSDGELTPYEILSYANRNNISTISITDHDTLLGVNEAVEINDLNSVKVIPGIELGAHFQGGQLHILGYGISFENTNLNLATKLVQEDNIFRVKFIVEQLCKYKNITFNYEDLKKMYSSKGTIGRPDIAKLLVKYGHVKTVRDGFKIFNQLPKYKKTFELLDYECIKLIKDAGGIACLAHNITLKRDITFISEYIEKLVSYGLEAIEVYHSEHDTNYSNLTLQIAEKFNLLISGGSDYHGPIVKPNIQIGTGRNNNINITDLSIVHELERRKLID